MPVVTVAICTYHRTALLRDCLTGLDRQTAPRERFDVLVVDNYGEAACRSVATAHGARYVHEPTPGLSYARNRAAREAGTEWIFYLDDDAVAHPDLLERFVDRIGGHPAVQVLGGRYEHAFAAPPPAWVRHYYRRPVRASPLPGLVRLPGGAYLAGCVFAARRDLLLRFAFRPDLGMRADRPGYGEESEWQDRVRSAGYPVFFDGGIAIDHLVRADEQTVARRIRQAYAHGRYRARTRVPGSDEERGRLAKTARILFVTLPYDLGRVLFKRGFYWQNGVVSTVGKLAFAWASP